MQLPINLKGWIEEHRHLLKPPVGNQQVWEDREFLITLVGGPNSRADYHINEGEEFFYQLEGDIELKMIEGSEMTAVPVRQGDIFLLPPRVPHSPQRPGGTLGMVIERKRLPHEKDGFVWFCEGCGKKLYEEFFHLTNIVEELPPLFQRFYENPERSTCKQCGVRATRHHA